jgi:hypothetical protein
VVYIIQPMATQFVHENNQMMLWKIVNSIPQLADFFATVKPGFKEEWFKGIIHEVYGETYGKNISLRDINKRAIDYMLESIKKFNAKRNGQQTAFGQQQSVSTFGQQQTASTFGQQQSVLGQQQTASTFGQQQTAFGQQTVLGQQPPISVNQTSSSFRDSRESQLMDQFNRRQAEYESMTKKTIPTPIFNDSIKDEAIQDISKAVDEYKNMRDAEIAGIIPENPQPIRIQIAEQIDIPIETDDIINQKKQVQWGENVEHIFDKTQTIYESALMKRIQQLEDKIDQMTKTIIQILDNTSK